MRASWFSAAAAIWLVAAPVQAQNRPLVFVHGLTKTGSEWSSAASYLVNLLQVDTLRPTLYWEQAFETQANNLEYALGGRTNAVAVSHSNGGIVTRQYGRTRGSSSRITGHVAVGSLHQGAALAANFLNGALGAYMDELYFSIEDPVDYYYQNDPDFKMAVDSNYEFAIWLGSMLSKARDYASAAAELATGVGVSVVPVLPQMCPEGMQCPGSSSNFIADLNSTPNLAAERDAFQQRISISTEVPISDVWARAWCPSGCTGVPPVIADIALTEYDRYRDNSNPVLQYGAYKWLNLRQEMFHLDQRWLELIGAVTSNGVVPTDGVLPITTQAYVGGTQADIHLNGANIAHGEQPTSSLVRQTLADLLRTNFGIPERPLQVTISGLTNPPSGPYTWTANAIGGGTPNHGYQWEFQNEGSSTWISLGTQQSQTRQVNAGGPNFTIRVTAYGGGQTASATLFITAPPVPPEQCGHWEVRPVLDGNGQETGSYENVWVPEECNPPPCTDGHWESQPILDGNGEETGSYHMVWVPDPGCE